ncbi:MAG TPA: PAS domain S-box protein, partial [bacterium]
MTLTTGPRERIEALPAMNTERPSSALLQAAVTSAPIILWTADPTGILTLFEGRGVTALGMQPGQLVGSSVLDYFAGRPEMQAQVRHALAGNEVHFESYSNGRAYEHWIEPTQDAAGTLTGIVGATIDVTARFEAQEGLRRTEGQFRALAEGSVQGIAIHRDRKYLYVNKAYVDLLGYASQEEIFALPSIDVAIAPEEVEHLREFARRRMTGEEAPEVYESDTIRKDGTRITCLVLSRVVQWQGEPAIQSTLIDITERKHAEAALQASQRLLATVFDAIPHPMVVKDKQDRYVMVNKAWTRLIGLAAEQIKDHEVARWSGRPAEEIARVKEENDQVLSGAVDHFEGERMMTTREGDKRSIRVVKEPLRDGEGQVMGLVAISMDMTEHRRSEADLREKEWMLSRAAQAARIGTWFREIRTGKLRWSDETYRVLGLTPETYDPTTQGYVPLMHPDDRAEYQRLRDDVERNGGHFRHEHRIFRPSGEQRIVLVTGERYNDEQGSPIGVIGIFQDVTDQRISEARLLHSEKMEVVGRLTAGVAHDFNNLLTVIRGNLELLRRTIGEMAVVKPLVESVIAAADRGPGLVRQLSAIARRQPLEPATVQVGPVLYGLHSLLKTTLGSDVQLQTQVAPETWNIRVDAAQLQSAILNLAINARDAMQS